MTADRTADDERLIDLMVGYQNGDMDCFSELYSRLEQPLLRYLWTFVRNRSTAEDLLQETFLQLHRARHTYSPRRPVKPWIYAITRHVALMHLRSQRRRREEIAPEELPPTPVAGEAEAIPDTATLQRILATLPREGQEVLILHHLLGLSFQEVGQVVGTTEGAAKVRSHRALKKLREQTAVEGEAS